MENFLDALLMNIDQRENELIAQGSQQDNQKIKELSFDYYRCASLIKVLEEDEGSQWDNKRKYCLFKAGFARCPKYMGQDMKGAETVYTLSDGNPFDNEQMKAGLNALKRQLSNPKPVIAIQQSTS